MLGSQKILEMFRKVLLGEVVNFSRVKGRGRPPSE